ncbi:MAG TPA: hypothetical protein VMR50_11560 [Myxococcota bacterium]|nr:hypothetical protein [Myxococcota bacterium]
MILLVAAALAGACSSGEQLASAEAQVPHFRQLMAARRFEEIYETGSEDLKKAGPEEGFVKFLGGVDGKLGAAKDSERTGWNVNFNVAATYVTLGFKTHFERGDGEEIFVYRVADKEARLVGYHVTSNAFVTN